jgi:hypothetical protein
MYYPLAQFHAPGIRLLLENQQKQGLKTNTQWIPDIQLYAHDQWIQKMVTVCQRTQCFQDYSFSASPERYGKCWWCTEDILLSTIAFD